MNIVVDINTSPSPAHVQYCKKATTNITTPMSYSPKELNSHSILRNKFSKSVAEGPEPAYDPRRSEYENFAYHPKGNNPPIAAA